MSTALLGTVTFLGLLVVSLAYQLCRGFSHAWLLPIMLDEGAVSVAGLDVASTNSRELARTMAVLRQENHLTMRLTVRDLVAFGRFQHSGGRPTVEDFAKVEEAIAHLDLTPGATGS